MLMLMLIDIDILDPFKTLRETAAALAEAGRSDDSFEVEILKICI